MKRPPHPLTNLEAASSTKSGCITCHAIGKPNADGSIGNCTLCHTRHTSPVEVARLPSTCGQCHLGPDHSQIEIYTQSKHGIMVAAHPVDHAQTRVGLRVPGLQPDCCLILLPCFVLFSHRV